MHYSNKNPSKSPTPIQSSSCVWSPPIFGQDFFLESWVPWFFCQAIINKHGLFTVKLWWSSDRKIVDTLIGPFSKRSRQILTNETTGKANKRSPASHNVWQNVMHAVMASAVVQSTPLQTRKVIILAVRSPIESNADVLKHPNKLQASPDWPIAAGLQGKSWRKGFRSTNQCPDHFCLRVEVDADFDACNDYLAKACNSCVSHDDSVQAKKSWNAASWHTWSWRSGWYTLPGNHHRFWHHKVIKVQKKSESSESYPPRLRLWGSATKVQSEWLLPL